jgi:hypothetical protein
MICHDSRTRDVVKDDADAGTGENVGEELL